LPRRRALAAIGVALFAGYLLTSHPLARGDAAQETIRVPQDEPTIQQAVDRAEPGDRILVDGGTYPGGVVVPGAKHDLTIEGIDRNGVVLDGGDVRKNGISVHADGVSLLNMSAHNFVANAFYWEDADRFRASYLTVWNVEGYGIYIESGEVGTVDHDYVSGAADAAYYVGECRHCRATLSHVVAALSAVGYSGTNASELVIRDSLWDRNGAGIVPNSYANEAHPPQARATILRNTVTGSGRARVPIGTPLAGFIGTGIAIAGGNENIVRDNRVTRSERYGIAVFPTAQRIVFDPGATSDPGPWWRARGNKISGNRVSGSGRADLALATGSGAGNCFTSNTAARRRPADVQVQRCTPTSRAGDAGVAAALTAPVRKMFDATVRRRRPPRYTTMPAPPPQPNMPEHSR
jgi:Right handed beta helix region